MIFYHENTKFHQPLRDNGSNSFRALSCFRACPTRRLAGFGGMCLNFYVILLSSPNKLKL